MIEVFFTCVLEFENGELHALPNAVLEPNLASQSSILNLKNNDTMFQYLMVLLTEGEHYWCLHYFSRSILRKVTSFGEVSNVQPPSLKHTYYRTIHAQATH